MTMTDSNTGWPVWKLAGLLWPFVTLAVAINLFLIGLMWQAIGLPAIAPVTALIWSLPLSLPASWAAGRWLRHLMDQAGDADHS